MLKKLKILRVLLLCCAMPVLFAGKKGAKIGHVAGTISATVNGISQSFNLNAGAIINETTGSHSLSISGVQNTTVHSYSINIAISSPNNSMASGTFTSGVNSNDVQITYSQTSTNLSYTNNSSVDESNATVIINSVTSSSIRGTFSGTIILQSGNGPESIEVTGGIFNVPLQ